ncbi:MAG: hypothetical protein KF773_41230 [Deltaproteobacteria bacterium]|nr:hypothetical protein [Deltaproteobacteria bacterium]MCW5803971.1 hypothetical protein [Deltaproteobacteria bacterium]
MKLAVATLLLASCWKTGTQAPEAPRAKGEVRVDLSSVSLGDDCLGDDAAANRKAPSAGDMAPDGSMPCTQTAMALSLSAGEDTSVRVKRVELLDEDGRVLGDLTARSPMHWRGDGYVAWDQVVKAGEIAKVTYNLHGLDWNKVPGGRWAAQEKKFSMRVTVTAGDKERTVEKTVDAPAMIEAPVVT